MEYTGLSIVEVGELCYYDYLLLLRDAVIYTLSQSKKGREYLEECWILEQTDIDRASMRKFRSAEYHGEINDFSERKLTGKERM